MNHSILKTDIQLKEYIQNCIKNANLSVYNWKNVRNIRVSAINKEEVKAIFLHQMRKYIIKEPIPFNQFKKHCTVFISSETRYIESVSVVLEDFTYYNNINLQRSTADILNTLNYTLLLPTEKDKTSTKLEFSLNSIENINF